MTVWHLSYYTYLLAYMFMHIPKGVLVAKVAKSVVLTLGIDSSVIIACLILGAGEKSWY